MPARLFQAKALESPETYPRKRAAAGLRGLVGLCLCLATACTTTAPTEPPKPVAPVIARPAPTIQATSEESASLRAYFAQVQSAQLTQGLLRRDGGGPDTPFTSEMLTRNFLQIAFYNEYVGESLRPGSSGFLRRWDQPVRLGLEFGASVPQSQRTRDTADVRRYANRLARRSGHSVSLAAQPNFIVAFLSEDDRPDALPVIAERLGLNPMDLNALRTLPRDIYCLVVAFPDRANPTSYGAAVAIIRAENPDLLRLSCIHEEVAQGMGLANDSPNARPSIFNDDDEFALLTTHDEHLLNLLYSDRLRTGMSIAEAEPILREEAAILVGDAPAEPGF